MSVGLVLEGGGMRGAYTSGVLETFLQNQIEFPVVYGISAGACNALSYISRQPGRNYQIFHQYLADERYISVTNLRKTGSLFGFDFIFGELFHELLPFDYRTFFDSPIRLRVGTTDMHTGQVVFYDKEELDENMMPVRASSSIPFVSNIVSYKGRELLDGGIAMPIPIERSLFDGNQLNVVVLTRDASYRKRPRPEFSRAVLRVKYGDYPHFIDTMMKRSEVYNNETEVCRRQEKGGNAVVIRPSSPIVIGRYEKDPNRLAAIYEMGQRDAESKLAEIRTLLKSAELEQV